MQQGEFTIFTRLEEAIHDFEKRNIKRIFLLFLSYSALLLRHDNLATKHYLSTVISDLKHEYMLPNMHPQLWNSYTNISTKIPRSCKDIMEKGKRNNLL